MDSAAPVLTIDGPSGSGKGTISRIVAQRLGWHYLDSGALYRAVGVAAGWADLDLDDGGALVRCTFDTVVAFREDGDGELRVLINGNDATDELRTETAGAAKPWLMMLVMLGWIVAPLLLARWRFRA